MQSVIYSRSSHNKKQQRSFNSNSLNNALYHSPFFVKSVNNNLFNTRQASLYKNKYSSSEPSLLLPCLYIQKASTQLRRLHSTQIRRLHSTSNNINDQYTQRPDELPIWPKIIEQSWKLEKLFKSFKESKIISDETIEWREFFDEMEKANEVKLSAGVSIIKLNFKNLSLFGMNEPQNIIVRDCYPDLFDKVIASERVILIGNPGIGKSWFQWYMIYRWIKDLKANEENNSMADSTRRRDPPNIVIRQEPSAAYIFFLSEKRVFKVKTFLDDDLRDFNENAYFFFEPAQQEIRVPYFHRLPILASVSPDITRYKEFEKNGGRKIFMPCWKLEELLSVGEVYNYPPLKIRERFAKFGGIIRYMFLKDVDSKRVEINQQKSIDSLTSYDLNNLFRSTIEKSPVQDRIPSISHFIKQFNVITDPNNPSSFMEDTVKLEWASEYVRDAVYNKLQNDKYFEIVQTALNMCKGVLSPDPILFESLTAKGATRCELEICAKKKIIGKDVVESEMINSKLPQFKSTELWENQKFDDLKENVLYRPKSKQYPFVDFIFKMSNELCALQISISKSHPKKPSTFLKFFDGHLKSQDSITCAIYYITTPDNVDSYIKATRSTFFSDEPELKDEVNAKFENALSRTTFYIINSFYSPSFFTKEVQNSNDRNDK